MGTRRSLGLRALARSASFAQSFSLARSVSLFLSVPLARSFSLACVVCATLATGAEAQEAGLFTPPEGCTAYLTVQHRSCRVEHHFTCADTGTDRWRIVYEEEGPIYLSRINAEAQWLSSRGMPSGGETVTLLPAKDPASMTQLLNEGFDAFDFEQQRPDGRIERVVGEDRIIGDPIQIDGEPLYQTEFNVTFYTRAGEVIGTYGGNEFVSPRHRRFFAGQGRSIFDGVEAEFDRTPKTFHYPDEAGFLVNRPIYDCGVMMSQLGERP